MVESWEDVTSLPGDALGISPNLFGKDVKGIEKFLEHHYEAIFQPFLLLSFLRVGDWGKG